MVSINSTRKPSNEIVADLVDEKLGNFREYLKDYPTEFHVREPSFGDSIPSIYFILDGEVVEARAIPEKKITFSTETVRVLYYTKFPQDRWFMKQIIKEILIGNSIARDTRQWASTGLEWLEVNEISYSVLFEGQGETVGYGVALSLDLHYQENYFNLTR